MPTPHRGNRRVLIGLVLFVGLMTGLSFAAVPFYNLFCRATGYNGTTGRATAPSATVLDRQIEVRFDAAVNPQLPWRFKPDQRSVKVKVGETGLASYHAENLGARPMVGTATYNVQPDKVGKYFVKIQCFCFSRQTLKPGETAELPLAFYVDPKIADDHNLDDVKSITLSYTFFHADSNELDKEVGVETTRSPIP